MACLSLTMHTYIQTVKKNNKITSKNIMFTLSCLFFFSFYLRSYSHRSSIPFCMLMLNIRLKESICLHILFSWMAGHLIHCLHLGSLQSRELSFWTSLKFAIIFISLGHCHDILGKKIIFSGNDFYHDKSHFLTISRTRIEIQFFLIQARTGIHMQTP